VGLIGLVLFELGNVTTYYFPSRAVPSEVPRLQMLSQHGDLGDFIRLRGESGRVQVDRDLIPYNFGAWYGLDVFDAPGASVLADVWNIGLFPDRERDFFGVRYYLGKQPNHAGEVEVFHGQSGINVYENPAAFPRAFAVHRTVAGSRFPDGEID